MGGTLHMSLVRIFSVGCCIPIKQGIPVPKLLFPGATDLAIKSFKDTVAIVSKWTSRRGERSGYGNILAHILSATSNLMNLLSSAVSELEKAMEHDRAEAARISTEQGTSFLRKPLPIAGLGAAALVEHYRVKAKAALRDIEAKLVTVKERLEEAKRCIEQGETFDVPIKIAAEQCEEILAIFYGGKIYLSGNDNCLFISPSLVAFLGIYAGVAGFQFQFQMFSRDREYVVKEMKTLQRCVEAYREEAVAQRLSYVFDKNYGRGTYLGEQFCADHFNESTSSKKSCPTKSRCNKDEDFHVFSNIYSTSLEEIYRGHFDGPLQELGKFVNKYYFPRLQ